MCHPPCTTCKQHCPRSCAHTYCQPCCTQCCFWCIQHRSCCSQRCPAAWIKHSVAPWARCTLSHGTTILHPRRDASCMNTRMHTHLHLHAHIRAHPRTPMRVHTHMQTRARALTPMHRHAHTHAYTPAGVHAFSHVVQLSSRSVIGGEFAARSLCLGESWGSPRGGGGWGGHLPGSRLCPHPCGTAEGLWGLRVHRGAEHRATPPTGAALLAVGKLRQHWDG